MDIFWLFSIIGEYDAVVVARDASERKTLKKYSHPLPTCALRGGSNTTVTLRFPQLGHISLDSRASRFWVYAYPAFLRYAAHSSGGYWARILPQAPEIAS
jgi:hypothetical protein